MSARILVLGRNSSFSPDAVQRLGSVYGLSPGLCLPARRHLPDTISHSAAVAESAPDRLGYHCSPSDGGDFCQVASRRFRESTARKARPQQNGTHGTLQHRGLRPSPPSAEADCSALELVFWLSVFVAFLVFLKWVHV